MRVRKQKDGKYYRKIVKWEKNNEFSVGIYFGWALFGISLGSFFSLIDNYSKDILIVMISSFVSSICAFIGNYLESHKRKVKFERISK